MKTFTDWLAATFYTPDDLVQTHKDVAASQQAILDRQYAQGKTGMFDYLAMTQEIGDAGTMLQDYKDTNGGTGGFLKTIPWFVWAGLALVGFWWLGGFYWIKGILKPKA
jgi:hypothetical protein